MSYIEKCVVLSCPSQSVIRNPQSASKFFVEILQWQNKLFNLSKWKKHMEAFNSLKHPQWWCADKQDWRKQKMTTIFNPLVKYFSVHVLVALSIYIYIMCFSLSLVFKCSRNALLIYDSHSQIYIYSKNDRTVS